MLSYKGSLVNFDFSMFGETAITERYFENISIIDSY
jgi:hypothetical protein